MGGNEIDLEAAVRRNLPLLLELGKISVRADRVVGIEQIAEAHVLRRRARLEPVTRARGRRRVQAKHLVGFFQRRIVGKDGFEVRDPVAALAGLAIGNAQQARPERRG